MSYDWVSKEWWEVFYWPPLSWVRRLLGQSEERETRVLTRALAAALGCLPCVREVRWWYESYNVAPSGAHTVQPDV